MLLYRRLGGSRRPRPASNSLGVVHRACATRRRSSDTALSSGMDAVNEHRQFAIIVLNKCNMFRLRIGVEVLTEPLSL